MAELQYLQVTIWNVETRIRLPLNLLNSFYVASNSAMEERNIMHALRQNKNSRFIGNLLQPIRSTAQIWVVARHHYGISAFNSLTSFFERYLPPPSPSVRLQYAPLSMNNRRSLKLPTFITCHCNFLFLVCF